jgi:hypothetical protein
VHPTLSRIDRVFVCIAWCDIFAHHSLRAGSSSGSNHAPLLLHTNVNAIAKKRFCFESIWSKFLGYLDVVVGVWQGDVLNIDAFRALDCKF